jgi:putative endonuclease
MSDSISIASPNRSSAIGEIGERLAAEYLSDRGYRLIISNFKVPVGRNSKGVQVTGEIDIVAWDADSVLCFVEVKTRSSEAFAGPLSAVDLRKQRQITRTSKVYKRVFGLWKTASRFDVVTVVMRPEREPKIELIRGFWAADKFRKRRWEQDIYHQNF